VPVRIVFVLFQLKKRLTKMANTIALKAALKAIQPKKAVATVDVAVD
jgi:hypothetical protein